MQPTQKYYEADAYRREADAVILAAEPDGRGGGKLALDGTVFYPEGGGQPADHGTLTLPDGTVQHYEEDVNRRYEREMEYFVDYALTGSGESCNPPALALNVLKLTLGENVQ